MNKPVKKKGKPVEETTENVEEVVLKVIEKVRKQPFSFFTEEDLVQEAWIIIQGILPKWDKKRPLENFLMSSIVRRLKSFSRSYFRSQDRRKVTDFYELQDKPVFDMNSIDGQDLYEFVSNRLPDSMRTDFRRLVEEEPIPSTRKTALLAKIKEILNEE